MHLLNNFLNGLNKEKVYLDDVRLVGVEDILQRELRGSISEFSKKHSLNAGSVSSMLKGKRAIPLKLLDLDKVDFRKVRWCINGSLPIKLPLELDNLLAYLVGALRDGTVAKEMGNEYTVSFYSIDRDYIEVIRDYVRKCFGIRPRITRFGDCLGVRIRSKPVYLFFRILFEVPPRQVYWDTPKLIKKSNDVAKSAYISGFFDAEGTVPRFERLGIVKRKNLYARFVQKNKESLSFIKEELEMKGIKCGKVYWSDEKWNLKISSSKSLKLFSKFVNLRHPMKARRLSILTKRLSL